jgi:hypothetical protein
MSEINFEWNGKGGQASFWLSNARFESFLERSDEASRTWSGGTKTLGTRGFF